MLLYTSIHKLTSSPSIILYLFFLPVLFLSFFFSLSPRFFISCLKLYLFGYLSISLLPFSYLPSLSPPFSLSPFLPPSSWPLLFLLRSFLPPSTALPLPLHYKCNHPNTVYILYHIFPVPFLCLDVVRYTDTIVL